MSTLRETARSVADEIRDGIAWVILYRVGRSWESVSTWSNVEENDWTQEDLADAVEVLKTDPNAVILNGYYCGHLGADMTVEEIAKGIRWHYENGYNRLADCDRIGQSKTMTNESEQGNEKQGHTVYQSPNGMILPICKMR